MLDYYRPGCCGGHQNHPQMSVDDDILKMAMDMAASIWKQQRLPDGLISRALVKELANLFYAEVEKAFKGPLDSFDYDSNDYQMIRSLRENVWQFSAAKNYTQLRELGNALVNSEGRLRTFSEFMAEAMVINDRHIKQWLIAEYYLAVAGAQMSAKWNDITKNEQLFPILEFDAVIDGQTTEICSSLHGTRLPVNHPFWQIYYPPNHFGCRSTVRQLRGGARETPLSKIPNADIPEMFQTNLGQRGLIFPKDHPYFTGLPEEVRYQAGKIMNDE